MDSLFRDNTPGTALLSAYCKSKGLKVISGLLVPFFREVSALPLALELDSNRCSEEEAAANAPILIDLIERLLFSLYGIAEQLPS